ncbi:MAG: nucleoside triphosphate pyrophosphohydrolase family protein [Methylococcaceae bacterium]
MNKHLRLVREFHDAFSVPQPESGANVRLSEMAIIMRQALLMEAGGELFRAIKSGDMVNILASMINLSYSALGAVALQGADVFEQPVSWQHDGFVISIMRLFSDKINKCTSGSPEHYSDVYCLCVYLSSGFINADFDKAFQMVHDSKISKRGKSEVFSGENTEGILKPNFFKISDLSDCLYE